MLTSLKIILRLLKRDKLKFLFGLPKSLYFNIHYFGFQQGLKLPIVLSNRVKLIKCKGKLIINSPLKTGMIRWGFTSVPISTRNERSVWNVQGRVIFVGSAEFGVGTKIAVWEKGILKFGDNFRITANSAISCLKEINFGNDCLLSWDILVIDTDAHFIYDENNNIINHNRKISIGNKVWIGCRCLLLKGSQVSDNSVIAANTILTKKFMDENIIIGGHYPKILKHNITWGSTIE